jgi:ArsR family transcriptional regulator
METFLQVFKILSDENRLRISMLLYQKPLCVGELTEVLGVSQPTVSKALIKLKDLNLVYNDKIEQFNLYYLNKDKVYYMEILDRVDHHILDHPCLINDRKKIDLLEDAPRRFCCKLKEKETS